jgi:hypothetical protein
MLARGKGAHVKNRGFLKGAIAGLLTVVVVSSGIALAANPFTDVPAGKFYADAVDWAYNNDITTGSPAGSTTFKPDDPVTRGENVTFAKRYDDNVVQPALAERLTTGDEIAMFDFATGTQQAFTSLTDTPIVGAEVTVTVPAGHTAYVDLNFTGESYCTGGTGTIVLFFFFGPWCEVNFYYDGAEIFGDGAAFDSVDKDTNVDTNGDETTFSWEGHALGYVDGPLEAGSHTFTAYAGSAGATPPTFSVGDWSFTAEVHLAS